MAALLALHRLPRLASRLRAPVSLTMPRVYPPIIHHDHLFSIRLVHAVGYQTLEPSLVLEEELVRGYKAEHYYPVRIGETFRDRYKVIGKLGYGLASTVWLCRDLRSDREYVALKVYINCSKLHREVPIYTHINSLRSQHDGHNHVRRLLDSFEISGPAGRHTCLVHEALGMNLEEPRHLVPGRVFAADLIRQSLRDVLRAMHFLHEEAHVVHTE